MKRWDPPVARSEREERLLKLAGKSRKLLVFLRERRHEIFDAGFQAELESMYRGTDQGEEPQPPALMSVALLLQGYLQVSDAEAVRLSATDLCWRLVLGTLNRRGDEPAFSQGGLQQFRDRMIRHDMDRRLLERTIEVAKTSRAFDWRKLPKTLRVAVDSRPLAGAGRVEDTINLLGHAGRKIAECVAIWLETTFEEVCRQAGAPLLLGTSIKAALDIDWNDADAKQEALTRLCMQLDRLSAWVTKRRPEEIEDAPLNRYIEALAQVKAQDVEPAPQGGVRLRQGVAEDRRISIEDAEMRHGRKSKSKRFDGYKQHVSTDLETDLVLACAVTPANRPEEEATPALAADMAHLGIVPDELQIDRAYLNSDLSEQVIERGGTVVCKPWKGNNSKPGLFGKKDFLINTTARGPERCRGGARHGRVGPCRLSLTVSPRFREGREFMISMGLDRADGARPWRSRTTTRWSAGSGSISTAVSASICLDASRRSRSRCMRTASSARASARASSPLPLARPAASMRKRERRGRRASACKLGS